MKGLKKVALASAIAAVSAGAQAELKALDDATLGETTGQAGITIDLETKWTIGEFMYKDAVQTAGFGDDGIETDGGALLITGISLGGNANESTSASWGAGAGLVANDRAILDNARLTIDVAHANEELAYGMSEVIGLAAFVATVQAAAGGVKAGIAEAANALLTGGAALSTNIGDGLAIDNEREFGDGDLLIHEGFTDPFQKLDSGSGLGGFAANLAAVPAGAGLATATYDQLLNAGTRAVDFNFSIDGLGIAGSAYTPGAAIDDNGVGDALAYDPADNDDDTALGTTTTRLLSNIDIKGYLGPIDLHIENNGNGFDGTGQLAVMHAASIAAGGPGLGSDAEFAGNANSQINWDRYFRITDLDIYIDIAGVQIDNLEVHNIRGDKSGLNTVTNPVTGLTERTTSLGFAHSKQVIYAVNNNVLDIAGGAGNIIDSFVDGVAINTTFKGDVDIHGLSFGDTGESIGQIFLTDVESVTNWTISAH